MKRFLTSIFVLWLSIGATSYAAPRPESIPWSFARQYDAVMEHQTQGGATQTDPALIVHNFGGAVNVDGQRCAWDPDEWATATTSGKWSRNEVRTFRLCFVNDEDGQLISVTSDTRLNVALRVYDYKHSEDRSWTIGRGCVFTKLSPLFNVGDAPYSSVPYDWERFPNTGAGGIGRVWMAEVTVTAPKGIGAGWVRFELEHPGHVQFYRDNCNGLYSGNPLWTQDSFPRIWENGLLKEDTGIDFRHTDK